MTKELWICIIIIIVIFLGDFFTQKYTKLCINEADSGLRKLREELISEEVDFEKSQKIMKEIQEKWGKRHPKLSYYIEHDEIEKVETEMAGVNGYIEIGEYKEAVVEVDKTMYILEHIKGKSLFNLENIF